HTFNELGIDVPVDSTKIIAKIIEEEVSFSDFVNLMKDLFLHLDAPFGWIEYEDYWPDRSSDDVLDGKVPTGNSYVFIGKKYVAKLNKAELKKTDFAKLNNGGILIHNRKLENGRSAFDSTPSTG
ncbi:hypothetical protein KKH30_04520, partial [Candidatus Micrarchaeota archaeon]|nr:hypothetical protein [Candidatus Micrarchaeota archaeon]